MKQMSVVSHNNSPAMLSGLRFLCSSITDSIS
jgi:hypothetical protein